MSEIPKPTEADLARDAAADYHQYYATQMESIWLRRAHAAEADVKRLRGELVALSPLCEQLRDAKERAEVAEGACDSIEQERRKIQWNYEAAVDANAKAQTALAAARQRIVELEAALQKIAAYDVPAVSTSDNSTAGLLFATTKALGWRVDLARSVGGERGEG